ncbi:MAG: UpxY family transcription antiterminator [Bacteroidales bacterium]|nr:UpxY family transcription antiterminator [Bacteroidales bacterium]
MIFFPKLWHAFYCRSRSEKRVNDLFLQDGYDAYLPLRNEVRKWCDRKKKVKLPLLPGYIFVRCSRKDIQSLVKYPHVVAAVKNLTEYAVITQDEIDRLNLVANGNYEVDLDCKHFAKGDSVIIKAGPFKGCEAIISDKNKTAKICVHLASINVNFTLTIHKSQLEFV